MTLVLILVYLGVSYWAAKRTIFANSILIDKSFIDIVLTIALPGALLGPILIPVALIKSASGK